VLTRPVFWPCACCQTCRTCDEIRQLERLIDELLDQHGTTLRDEPGIETIAAATLICEKSKFARWCGTGAVALSSGEGGGEPVKHRLDFRGNRRINSVLYIASVTQQRDRNDARTYIDSKTTEGKKTAKKPDEPTNATSPTESSAACGKTKKSEPWPSPPPLDKGVSDTPARHA